ncbi:MAG: LPS export ABC transporter permease LptF [Alphaproteobacteria bacterium]|nr:LPS export ABC transporter permease LptF [Alphaproteobacteria bacterium]
MHILDRYIFKQLVVGFLLIALGLTTLIWLSQSLRMIDWIVNKGVAIGLFIHLTLLALPNFVAIITPIAFFVTVMFVYHRLLSDKELVVMKACGMNLWQLIRPAFWLATVLVVCGYIMTLWLIPSSITQFKHLQFKIRNGLVHVSIQEGIFNVLPNNFVVYTRVFKPSGELKGILIYDRRNPQKHVVLSAQEGIFMPTEEAIHIQMTHGKRFEYDKEKGIFSSLSFDKQTMALENKESVRQRMPGEAELPLHVLLTATEKGNGLSAKDVREYRVEAVERLTRPLYAYVYLFVGLFPLLLGYYNRRGQASRIYFAVISVILLQSFAIGFSNLSQKNLWCLSLMVLNILVPIGLGVWILCAHPERLLKRWFKAFMCLALIVAGTQAQAASNSLLPNTIHKGQNEFVQDTTMDKTMPVDFEADAVSYDEKKEIVTASGHVIVRQGATVLTADELIYQKKTDRMMAKGHVELTRPDGVRVSSDELELSGDLKQGAVSATEMRLADGSTFIAQNIHREDAGNTTVLSDVSFTPCTYCCGKSPLWRVDASEIIHDKQEQEFTYKHALLYAKKVPVFYWPYLRYPDFQVKRKTGFLFPSLSHGRELGMGIETPFFWALTDAQDVTLYPTWSVTHTPLMQGTYRGLYNESTLNVNFSGTQDKDGANQGHIDAFYEWDINDAFRFKGQLFRTSSNSYFRRYPLRDIDDEDPWIASYAHLDYFGQQDYAYARFLSFQSLRRNISSDTMPYVPQFNYQYTTKPFWNGLYATTLVNGAGVYTQQNPDSSRLTLQQSFTLPYVFDNGLLMDTVLLGRADGYSVHVARNDDTQASRLYSNISAKLRYPWMQSGDNYSQVLEPIVMGVFAPNTKTRRVIPNEDSVDFELDDANLFLPNRYAGFDRVETGSRVNYGMQWSYFGPDSLSISAMVGQSYRIREGEKPPRNSGLDNYFSSYVGRVYVDYKDVRLTYRFRFNQDNFTQERSSLGLSVGRDPLRVSVEYLYQPSSAFEREKMEEITVAVVSKLTQDWSMFGRYQYNFANGGSPIKAEGGLQYENECLILAFTGEKEFTKDSDYKGDTSFFFRVFLKTLGGM